MRFLEKLVVLQDLRLRVRDLSQFLKQVVNQLEIPLFELEDVLFVSQLVVQQREVYLDPWLSSLVVDGSVAIQNDVGGGRLFIEASEVGESVVE